MRNVRLLVICLLSASFRLVFAQGSTSDSTLAWKQVVLGTGASIAMPATAALSSSATKEIPAYVARSHEAIYMVAVTCADSAATDGEQLSGSALDTVYAAAFKSLLRTGSQDRIVSQTAFTLAGQRGVEAQLDLPNAPNLARAKFARVFYFNGFIYILTWRETSSHAPTDEPDNRQHFFTSLRMKPSAPHPAVSGPRQLGRLLGQLLVLAAVVVGIVVFVRRQSRPAR
ncbi:MAG: hypothetical protein ACRYFX_01220 [Janthinobacterium lividum]